MGDSKTRGLEDDMFTKGRCGARDNMDLRTCGLRDVWTRRRCELGHVDSETCGLGDVWT